MVTRPRWCTESAKRNVANWCEMFQAGADCLLTVRLACGFGRSDGPRWPNTRSWWLTACSYICNSTRSGVFIGSSRRAGRSPHPADARRGGRAGRGLRQPAWRALPVWRACILASGPRERARMRESMGARVTSAASCRTSARRDRGGATMAIGVCGRRPDAKRPVSSSRAVVR